LYEYSNIKGMRIHEDIGKTMSAYRFTSINGRLDGGRDKDGKYKNSNIMLNQMRDLNLIHNKHIPPIYKSNSRENRLKLLAGLMDSDGSLSNNNCFDYVSKIKKLADDVVLLLAR
jgi:intein/homing endonuclease